MKIRARDRSGPIISKWGFGGGPHQGDQPFLHVGQEGVLLGLVEPVDLIDQDHGAGALGLVAPGLLHHPPQIGHPGHHCAQTDKVGVQDRGHNPGQGGLAAPRGAPEIMEEKSRPA